MQCLSLALLAGLLVSASAGEGPNPVSRVAELLKNLAGKIDDELDSEEKLYESYVCWAKTVITTKTGTNEKAQSRVDSLETYLADLDAGRIELTTERSDLEKEVAQLRSDLETAKNLRNKENDDYKAATKDMSMAIKSLQAAVKVLDEATKNSKGSLVSLRSSISQTALQGSNEGFSARVEEADELQHAVDVGTKWLKAGDALFLQRLLSGEVPIKDWKKLNRKAEFKMKYKARSVKIQDTLAKLLQTFKDNKADAEKTEKDAVKVYDALKKAKEGQFKASSTALNKGAVEGGAAAVSKSDSQAEVKALKKQITDDKKHIGDTEKALAKKKGEWVTRKELRVGEIAAINEAIAVIHSDDARDLFSKQQASFLQIDASSSATTKLAMSAIRDAAHASGDLRLSALAARFELNSGAKFDKVLTSITKMIKDLEQEMKDDASDKADCEKERTANTKESADLSRKIDDLSDDVSKLEGEIKTIKDEVAEKEETIADTKKDIKDAKALRKDENAEWTQNDADDTAAIKLLTNAANVLKNHYKNKFSLIHLHSEAVAPNVEAGKAPPAPPSTWGGDYGGAKKESNGIISILELIKKDSETDQKAAKASEDAAQKAHDKFVKDSEGDIKKLETAVNKLNTSKATKEKDIKGKKSTSDTKKGSLAAVVKKMKDAAPGCDFLLTKFVNRKNNRQAEIDGLKKAKGILKAQNK